MFQINDKVKVVKNVFTELNVNLGELTIVRIDEDNQNRELYICQAESGMLWHFHKDDIQKV